MQFLIDNSIKIDKPVTLEMFVQLFERNLNHILFKWFTELNKEYSGTLNGQFDPTEQ